MKSDKNSFEKDAIWLGRNPSKILGKQFKKLTGPKLPISVLSPFFNIGLNEAILAETKEEFLQRSLLILLVRCFIDYICRHFHNFHWNLIWSCYLFVLFVR